MTVPTARRARVFEPSDLVAEPEPDPVEQAPGFGAANSTRVGSRSGRGGISWGGLLISAAGALLALAASLWISRFVEIAAARQDFIGWIATALLATAGLALAALIFREIIGWFRLARLSDIREQAELALAQDCVVKQRHIARRIVGLYASRADAQWAVARYREHEGDVLEPGDLLELVEKDILAALDRDATQRILAAAKRVSIVTALSPSAFLAVGFVLYENLGLLRAIAGIYGGRPGPFGSVRILRMVITHIVATGGVTLTDDLFGQFLGQDALRRVSSRLGEGAFNGALTARLGAAAVTVCRPLPFRNVPPIRLRSMLSEVLRGAAPMRREKPRDPSR